MIETVGLLFLSGHMNNNPDNVSWPRKVGTFRHHDVVGRTVDC